jgi:hypothetical protein
MLEMELQKLKGKARLIGRQRVVLLRQLLLSSTSHLALYLLLQAAKVS